MAQYQVYRNLNNGKISIMDCKTRLVVGHADAVMLDDATLKVNQKGRERVVKEKRKNVHAFIIGHISYLDGFTSYKNREVEMTLPLAFPKGEAYTVKYNPFMDESFIMFEPEAGYTPIHHAMRVGVNSKGKMAAQLD